MPLIDINNVSTIFGRNPASILNLLDGPLSKAEILERHRHVVALRNVSLSIDQGHVFVIMGLSGSGKSTLIRHINRLIDPTYGRIMVDGHDILKASPRELQHIRQTRMSMVFQHFGLLPHKTILDNVSYGLEARGEAKGARREAATSWIDRVGLSGYEDNFPSQLSGGMQQRVGLARALATNPEILLMDEAFSALDPLIRHDMQNVLLELQKELGKTIVFITHDLDEALAIGDRIAILNDGRLAQVGAPGDIILTPADDYVERFVQHVNRAKALRVRSVMAKRPSKAVIAVGAVAIDADETLEQALPKVADTSDALPVIDRQAGVCGQVTRQMIVAAISGRSPASAGDDSDPEVGKDLLTERSWRK